MEFYFVTDHTMWGTWWRIWSICTVQQVQTGTASHSSSQTMRSKMKVSWSTWTTCLVLERWEKWGEVGVQKREREVGMWLVCTVPRVQNLVVTGSRSSSQTTRSKMRASQSTWTMCSFLLWRGENLPTLSTFEVLGIGFKFAIWRKCYSKGRSALSLWFDVRLIRVSVSALFCITRSERSTSPSWKHFDESSIDAYMYIHIHLTITFPDIGTHTWAFSSLQGEHNLHVTQAVWTTQTHSLLQCRSLQKR